jgi:hypothetical protein
MESNILIDINYATRDPQIVLKYRDSDDPRDKLISMFAGQAMPGVRDGYCRIERSHSQKDIDFIVITPLDPGEAIKHIAAIKKFAINSACINTTGFKERIERDELEAVDSRLQEILDGEDVANWNIMKGMLNPNQKPDLPSQG